MKKQMKIFAVAFLALTLFGCGQNAADNQFNPSGVPTGGGFPQQPGGGGGTSAGCIRIDQRIGFTGNNIYVDSYNIFAGRLPGESTQHGTVTVGAPSGTYMYSGQSGDGLLQMGFRYASNQYSTNGVILLSQGVQEEIRASFPAMQTICVTGVAVNLGYTDFYELYGSVYLYFNNSTNGIMLVY